MCGLPACLSTQAFRARHETVLRKAIQCPQAKVVDISNVAYRATGCGKSQEFICLGKREFTCGPLPKDVEGVLRFNVCGNADPSSFPHKTFRVEIVEDFPGRPGKYRVFGCRAGSVGQTWACAKSHPIAHCSELK